MEARRSREENATCWLIARGFGAKGDSVHVANMVDQEGIMPLLDGAKELFPRLSHLWLDAGYRGQEKGKGWALRRL
jgi:hypothetical protein